MQSFILAAVASLTLTGCISAYSEVAETAPSSTLAFLKGYTVGTGLARSSLQEYWIVEDQTCTNPQRAAWFTFANDPMELRRVPPDRRVSIAARTRFYEGAGGTSSGQPGARVNIAECRSLAQFTPELGSAYTVVQTASPTDGCTFTVVNAETGVSPPDLIIREPLACSDKALP
ncbi:MAG TPA: hypothetical protein PKV67_02725 [Hyphomonas sp.]|nr:hypothetical protein [Hyphomonas sp.]HRK66106.1 hypothetical protein [Hyphomonas sp.]